MKATQEYVKKELFSDIFKGRNTEEDKNKLLEVGKEYEGQLSELLKVRNTTMKALDVFSNFNWLVVMVMYVQWFLWLSICNQMIWI